MKILYLIDSLQTGGKERQLVELVKILGKDHQLHIIYFNGEVEYSDLHRQKVRLIKSPFNRKSLSYQNYLRRMIKQIKPDIIHTWDLVSTLTAAPLTQLYSIPLINGAVRGSARIKYWGRTSMLGRLGFMFSDKVVANSKAGLRARKRSINRKFKVVHNGFDLERVDHFPPREQLRKKYGFKEKLLVGMVSNFREGKDYKSFLQVADYITSVRRDVGFIAIGGGKQYEKYQQKYGKKKGIYLTGKQLDVEQIVKCFDIGVLLSWECSSHGEGISNAIMEYMALSLPVITSNSGGNPEIVQHGKNGFVVPEKDTEAFRKAVNKLLKDEKLRKQMGQASRKIIAEKFSLNKMAGDYLSIYKEVLE